MAPYILVTGGAGYVGTHVLAALAAAGRRCVSVDNYSNSSPDALERVARISGTAIPAYAVDVRDREGLRRVLAEHRIESVVHLAGVKAVAESVLRPDAYREINVGGTLALLEALAPTLARRLVFSSSATVYGASARMPVDETAECAPRSPYGENKLEIERILERLARTDGTWRIANLRYFNPVGAHPSGLIGELPSGAPDNLMPFVCQVAAGWRERLNVWGNDYPTADGSGVRDYLHVVDLAEGHVAALHALESAPQGTVMTVNLGTGRGHSVLELVRAFERVNRVRVPWEFGPRRPGDVPVCYADASRAQLALGWRSRLGIEDMCRDAWRWQRSLGPAPPPDRKGEP